MTKRPEYVKIFHIVEYVLIGNHPSIQKIRELITVVSDTAFNVLVMGETGTGKEVIARLLHHASNRRRRNFVKVNCPALPYTLLESELFGYEKGAFTGAVKFKPGKFEVASDGVVFLDEIGDMPLALQAKLLEVLQSAEFTRLGGTRTIKVNSWVIAATNHDLEQDMKQGLFRVDLYYRLNIIKIEIAPLRERKQDIPLLTKHFIKKHQRELKIEEPFSLDVDLQELFQAYHWPGNVRELSNIIVMLMAENDTEEVKSELLNSMAADGLALPTELIADSSDSSDQPNTNVARLDTLKSLKDLKAEATRNIEKKAIMHALNMTGWNKREAADLLKISYKALFYKMAAVGISNDKYQNLKHQINAKDQENIDQSQEQENTPLPRENATKHAGDEHVGRVELVRNKH